MIELPFLDLDLKTKQSCLRTNIYDKRDDVSFPQVYFPFIYEDLYLALSYGVYISLYF